MSLGNWLASAKRVSEKFQFHVYDVTEKKPYDEDQIKFLGDILVKAHGNPKKIKEDCIKLVEDARNNELYIFEKYLGDELLNDLNNIEKKIVEKYLVDHVLPDKGSVSTRIGNFGEIVAADFSIEFEDYWLPIYKLRYREKKNWASRLTDLCVIKRSKREDPIVCYIEVKTNSSRLNKKLGIEGHDSLIRDDALNDPEILEYISRQLYFAQKYEEGSFISDLHLGRVRYNSKHEVFIVHEVGCWSDEILDLLNKHDINPNLIDFTIRVILVKNLRDLIDSSYAESWGSVKVLMDE